ncbi:MAG: hypothetical protein Q8L02_03680 [Candidatus Nitrotoga sp.]|nr:hypothetical protein [Candidatus Nitrotoga sp.]
MYQPGRATLFCPPFSAFAVFRASIVDSDTHLRGHEKYVSTLTSANPPNLSASHYANRINRDAMRFVLQRILRSFCYQKATDCEGTKPAKETACKIVHPISPASPVAGGSLRLKTKLRHNSAAF